MSDLEAKNTAIDLKFIGAVVCTLGNVTHTSDSVYEVWSLNATIFNIKNQKDHRFHLKIDLSSTLRLPQDKSTDAFRDLQSKMPRTKC